MKKGRRPVVKVKREEQSKVSGEEDQEEVENENRESMEVP